MEENTAESNLLEFTENMINGLFSNDYFDALVPLFFHLNINGEGYTKQFQFSYMKYIYENISKKKAYIRSHTRFGRRKVDAFMKDIECEKLIKREKKNDIFNELVHKIRFACQNSDTNSIPLYGNPSFSMIFEESELNDKNLTMRSVLSFLENVGCVHCKGDDIVYIGMIDHKFRTSKKDVKRQFTNLINDYVTSTLHNIDPANDDNKFISRRVSSVMVGDDQLEPLLNSINGIALDARNKIVFELEKAEKNSSESQKNYIIGLHLLSFLINQRK